VPRGAVADALFLLSLSRKNRARALPRATAGRFNSDAPIAVGSAADIDQAHRFKRERTPATHSPPLAHSGLTPTVAHARPGYDRSK